MSFPEDLDLLVAGLGWALFSALWYSLSITVEKRIWRRFFAALWITQTLVASVLAASSHDWLRPGIFLALVVLGLSLAGAGVGVVTAAVIKRKSEPNLFRRRILFFFAIFGFGTTCSAIAVTQLNALFQNYEKAWTTPSQDLQSLIRVGIQSAVSRNFEFVAIDGKIAKHPSDPQPIADLALWIFTQRHGAALQPNVKIAGAQTANVDLDERSIQVNPLVGNGTMQGFRAKGILKLTHSLRPFAQRNSADGSFDRVWSEQLQIDLTGSYSETTRRLIVEEIDLINQ